MDIEESGDHVHLCGPQCGHRLSFLPTVLEVNQEGHTHGMVTEVCWKNSGSSAYNSLSFYSYRDGTFVSQNSAFGNLFHYVTNLDTTHISLLHSRPELWGYLTRKTVQVSSPENLKPGWTIHQWICGKKWSSSHKWSRLEGRAGLLFYLFLTVWLFVKS